MLFGDKNLSFTWSPLLGVDQMYCKGDLSALTDRSRPRVLITGTRDIRGVEEEDIKFTIAFLAANPNRPVIVTGLAFGTDTVALKFALSIGLPVVAVMATGLDNIYPAVNRDLAIEISSREECALLTPFPEGTQPLAVNFIAKNEVMSRLCDAAIIPFAKKKGGSIVCARMMADLGKKQVYALPGKPRNVNSQGCNELIRKGYANIIVNESELADIHV